MRKITETLYIGSSRDALVEGERFDTVISLADANKHTTHEFLIRDGTHEEDVFTAAVETVREEMQNDTTVFVHCRVGVSRSTSVVSAAYACENEIHIEDAYQTCKAPHMEAAPELKESMREYVQQEKGPEFVKPSGLP